MNFCPRLFLILLVIMGACNSSDREWKKIKQNQNVYPKDSIISYTDSTDFTNEIVWVNTSYRNYPYKKYCGRGVEVTMERKNPRVENSFNEDSLLVARNILIKFRKNGVAHFAGQILNSDNLVIYFYADDSAHVFLDDFAIPVIETLRHDEEWKIYEGLFKTN